MRYLRSLLAVGLGLSLALQTAWAGQSGEGLGLRIVIVSGDAIENVVGRPATGQIEVVVVDRFNVLIPGASVAFVAPERGPSLDFGGGQNRFETRTDAAGRAVAGRRTPNGLPGAYAVEVRAEFDGETARAILSQANIRSSGPGRLIAILSVVGAAAVGAAFAFGRDGADRPSSPPPGPSTPPSGPIIGIGDSSVGPPS